MSFTFRNLFSEEEGEPVPNSLENGFSSDSQQVFSAPPIDGVRGGVADAPDGAAGTSSQRTQAFLVSELLPFIPPAISATSGIPMEDEVIVSFPSDGSNDVNLSVIYQICPQLFAAEITPLNDSLITLPPKLGGTGAETAESEVELSGVAFGAGPLMRSLQEDPQGNSTSEIESADKANPFWSPEASSESPPKNEVKVEAAATMEAATPKSESADQPEGFSAPNKESAAPMGGSQFASDSPKGGAPEMAGGFNSPGSLGGGADDGNLFENGEDSPVEASVGGGESSTKPASVEGFSTLFSEKAEDDAEIPFPAPEQGESISGTWGTMFQGGFNPDESPATDTAPIAGFGDMLTRGGEESTGAEGSEGANEPNVSQNEVKAGSGEVEAAPFSGEASGFFNHSAESPSPPASQEMASGFGFSAPPKQADDQASELIPEGFGGFATVGPLGGSDTASVEQPSNEVPIEEASFEGSPAVQKSVLESIAVPEVDDMSAKEEPVASPTELQPALADLNPAPGFETNASISVQVGECSGPVEISAPTPTAEPAPASAFMPAADPAPAPAPMPAADPAPASAPMPAADPAPAPAPMPAADPAPASAFFGENQASKEDLRDLEMKAIFSTSEPCTLSMVARKVVGLPGMQSCALATPSHLVQASKSEQSRLGAEAQEMVDTVKNLAKLTGLPDAKSFTLQTDRGIVSLFMDGECCLIVRHDAATFGPGVREKLILTSRHIYKLQD